MLGLDARVSSLRTGIGKYTYEFTLGALNDLRNRCFIVASQAETFEGRAQVVSSQPLTSHPQVELWEYFKLSNLLDPKISLLYAPGNRLPVVRKTKGIRLACFLHDAMTAKFPEYYPTKFRFYCNFMLRRSLKVADIVFTNSEASKRDLLEFFSRSYEHKIFVNPLWVNKQTTSSEDSRSAKPFFLHIGTLEPRKNHLGMIEAIEQLPERIRNEFKFVFIGSLGWKCKPIESAILELQKRYPRTVQFLGRVSDEDILRLRSQCFGILFPSFYEGFGYPILEGFASNKPVITSRGSAMEEVGGDAVLLVEPKRPESIAQAITKLCESSDLYLDLTARGAERLRSWSWSRHYERFRSVIEDQLGISPFSQDI